MKRVNRYGCLLLCIATTFASALSAADVTDQDKPGIELGIGGGQGDLKGSIAGVGSLSTNGTGFDAFVGYRFDRYFSVEAGYLDGGQFTISATDGTDTGGFNFHPRAAQLSGVATLPIGNYFGIFGRIGADHWWLKTTAFFDGESASETDTATSLLWGGGAVAFVDGAQVRVEYQQSNHNVTLGEGLPQLDLRHRYIAASIVWLF